MGNPLLPAAAAPLAAAPGAAPVSAANAAASAANTYSNLNGLAALKQDSRSPQAMRAVGQQVDALFLQMMLKSMRDATAAQGDPGSNEMDMYQDMFDKQVALTLSQHGGLGLGSLLMRQSAPAAPLPGSLPAAAPQATAPAVPTAPAPESSAGPATPPTSALSPTLAPAAQSAQASAVTSEDAGDFVNRVLPSIRQAASALGLSPVAMLAQAVLETGWGKRMARTADGSPSLNLFGIKADGGWGGARATANTLEYSGGVAVQRRAAFRAYASVTDSVNDFANLLQSSPRYRSTAASNSPAAYVASIGSSGYATDPDYANKLNEILNSSTFRTALGGSIRKL
jgi:flagellar protein FlgJ